VPLSSRRRFLTALAVAAAAVAGAITAQTPRPTILVVGDSVSAGYGLAPGDGWVALLASRLAAEKFPHRVVNASISGDTTAGGKARLPALIKEHTPAIVIVELGGNDALRGQALRQTRANLDAMVKESQHAGADVLVLGMQLPPNYGAKYVREFAALFADVAKSRKVAFVPYLFEGFGESLEYFQSDRIHPTAAAQPRMLETVWPALKPLLGKPAK
jgi:acyl-CoA thioesterase-1